MRELIIQEIKSIVDQKDVSRYKHCDIENIHLFKRINEEKWDDLSDMSLIIAFEKIMHFRFICR